MITLNGTVINQNHFPDGSLMMLDFPTEDIEVRNRIVWKYDNDAEVFTLYCVVRHISNVRPIAVNDLVLPYIPHARMDRTKSDTEVFTLKYFAELINSLHFDRVYVLDPHSYVSEALINNIVVMNVEQYIEEAIKDIEGFYIDGGVKCGGTAVVYFPDEGAMKRYKDLKVFKDRQIIYGKKNRDWKTGKILGLTVHNRDGVELKTTGNKPLDDKIVIMIDDIISYGGTLSYSADAIKELGARVIYAYVTHTENSVLDEERSTMLKRLDDDVVSELFTTSSIYRGDHELITVIEDFE